jgi:hypothetical protein
MDFESIAAAELRHPGRAVSAYRCGMVRRLVRIALVVGVALAFREYKLRQNERPAQPPN